MRTFPRTLAAFTLAATLSGLLIGCGPSEDSVPASAATAVDPSATAGPRPVATTAPAAQPAVIDEPFLLVVLGDSLSAGIGLPPDASFSSQLANALAQSDVSADVLDASAAGDSAADGLARFDAAVPADADGVLIELGAADLARGAPPASVADTLSSLIERAQSRGLWVGLVGLSSPDATDTDYADAFEAIYGTLAREHEVPFYPDYYAGLIDRETGLARPELFLEDGAHPTDLGVSIVAEGVAAWLAGVLPREARGGG